MDNAEVTARVTNVVMKLAQTASHNSDVLLELDEDLKGREGYVRVLGVLNGVLNLEQTARSSIESMVRAISFGYLLGRGVDVPKIYLEQDEESKEQDDGPRFSKGDFLSALKGA